HSAWAMVRWTTSRSSGSFCWSACATPPRKKIKTNAAAPPARSRALRARVSAARERTTLFPHSRANERERIVERELGAFGIPPSAIFQLAGFHAALAHDQAMRNADELRVREFDARAGIAVVVEHFDAGGVELGVQLVGDFANTFRLLGSDGNEHHMEGRDRLRPDDAALIVILFNRRRHDARHTDAIAAHVRGDGLAGLVQHRRLHGFGVDLAELEDMADLDA